MPSLPKNLSPNTPARSLAARVNGAKSKGPVTPAGLERSSRNSLRHGLAAQVVVLQTESQQEFQTLLHSFLDRFQPADAVEDEVVHAMAAARWRIRRLYAIEATLLDNELLRRSPSIEDEFAEVDDHDRLARAFQSLADSSASLALLIRYEATVQRAYDRSFKQLHLLQAARAHSQNAPQPNEPNPPASSSESIVSRPVPLENEAGPRATDDHPRPSMSPKCDNKVSPTENAHHLYP